MATLDETNIFGLTPNQPEKKDDSLSRLGISESGYLNRLAQIQNMQKVAEGVKEKSEKKGNVNKEQIDKLLKNVAFKNGCVVTIWMSQGYLVQFPIIKEKSKSLINLIDKELEK